jgi:preprotein translocase subunit YajC
MRKDYDQVFFIFYFFLNRQNLLKEKKRDNREKSLERGEE